MKNLAIQAENISKQYRLGQVGTGTISHDLNRLWSKIRGKEDPYLKIGESNDRSQKGVSEYVWSLKDINFEIEQGDAVGIIGRNGAGKSTLLKLLSKVTKPTTGSFKVKGRIASLLEVGTGFNPEMTGRENIYLNGAILGMRKHEISRKFDEIVDFSGVERYIDTPVKRYSSGMYVRLAFAVAAHLESEILIVDEVLAVGDAEFQKKCLGKMGDVSKGEGRTVLFVSHNMGAVQNLCNKGILLENGSIVHNGAIQQIIEQYSKPKNISNKIIVGDFNIDSFKKLLIRSVCVLNADKEISSQINNKGTAFLEIVLEIFQEGKGYDIAFQLSHIMYGVVLCSTFKDTNLEGFDSYIFKKGTHKFLIELPIYLLREGDYTINVAASIPKIEVLDQLNEELYFSIIDSISPVALTGEGRTGVILPILKWNIDV